MVNQKKRARRADDALHAQQPLVLIGDTLHVPGGLAGEFAEANQAIRERLVGVHGHVAGDVVEDVGLGQVVEPGAIANGDGRGECPLPEAIEKDIRRHVTADRLGVEAGERGEEAVDVFQSRDGIGIQSDSSPRPAGICDWRTSPIAGGSGRRAAARSPGSLRCRARRAGG